MRYFLGILAAAGLAVLGPGVASAQDMNLRIGPGGVSVEREDYRPAYRERVIERRVVERPVRSRTVCRTVIREHVRPSGVVVRRPAEVCREVVGGRRVYVD
ncbi:hypothetical protein [Microvirga thermotolerans]|uniref:UrcA family protein n=1 Tax=Microvirga thermotolerans TaxID=2651334 RepID=A0A5P9JYN1_9HYPH|nr:hypothetical protein [Microvirga thermotolerans]QFU15034.1 hypothetical protein GDR74_01710 [Microvirga thermotolerans]